MHRSRALWPYLAGLTLNLTAQWMARTGMLIWVYSLTRSAPAVSLVGLVEAVPLLVTAPFAGVLVDRLSYRQVLIASTALQAVLVLPLLLARGPLAVPLILTVTFTLGIVAQVFGAASGAIVPTLAGPARLGWVNGASQLILGSVMAAAPGAASAVVWLLGQDGLVLVLLVCWLAAVPVLAALPADARRGLARRRTTVRAEVRAGLTYTIRTPLVRDVIAVACVASLGTGGLNALHVIFATRALHLAPAQGGVLIGAVGAGQLAGGLVVLAAGSRMRDRYHLLLLGTMSASSASLVWYACSPNLAWAVAALFVRGLTLTLTVVALTTLAQLATAPEFLGRVFSLVSAALAVAQLLSYSASGVLAQWVGIRPAIGLSSATLLLAVAVTIFRIRATPAMASEPSRERLSLAVE